MSKQVIALMCELETELQFLELWQAMPPSPEDLASELPFCVDTLPVHQWLQWIYIPRIRALIDAGAPLPSGREIHPYAEEALKQLKLDLSVTKLLQIIRRCDEAMK